MFRSDPTASTASLQRKRLRLTRPHRPLAKSFGVARVSAEEHMANYQAARARALLGKAKSGGGARKPAVKNGAKGMSDMAG